MSSSNKSKDALSRTIKQLPLLPGKTHFVSDAVKELEWAAKLAPDQSTEERTRNLQHSTAEARKQIEKLIGSIEGFLSSVDDLGSVATRSIDDEPTSKFYLEDIGYVYLGNTRLFMGALLDKARDALEDLPNSEKPRGRPIKNGVAENVTKVAAKWYVHLTGNPVTRKSDPYSGVQGSPFTCFLDEIFDALGVSGSSESLTKRFKETK